MLRMERMIRLLPRSAIIQMIRILLDSVTCFMFTYPPTVRRRAALVIVAIGAAVLVGGCTYSGAPAPATQPPSRERAGRICTAELRPGIVVDIQDSVTGAPRAFDALVIAAHDGQVDSVQHSHAPGDVADSADERRLRVWLAWEKPGTYDVAVHVAGYAVWSRKGIEVLAGTCHVVPVHLLARLARA